MRHAGLGAVLALLVTSAALAAEPNAPAANIAVITNQIDEQNRGDWKTALDVYTRDTRNFGRPWGAQ